MPDTVVVSRTRWIAALVVALIVVFLAYWLGTRKSTQQVVKPVIEKKVEVESGGDVPAWGLATKRDAQPTPRILKGSDGRSYMAVPVTQTLYYELPPPVRANTEYALGDQKFPSQLQGDQMPPSSSAPPQSSSGSSARDQMNSQLPSSQPTPPLVAAPSPDGGPVANFQLVKPGEGKGVAVSPNK